MRPSKSHESSNEMLKSIKERNFGLDVIRSISIILVLLAHRFTINFEIGLVGVQIFFVLSGFLIGQILINDFKKKIEFTVVLNFWKRRWYRTLPMYYLVLISKLLYLGNPFGWKIVVYFLFLQANFVGISFFGVSWSLVVEEWFYLFLPAVSLMFIGKQFEKARFLKILLISIAVIFAFRFFWNFFHFGLIIYQFDCLLLGVLLATVKIEYSKFYGRLINIRLFVVGLIGFIAMTLIFGNVDHIPVYATFYRVTWYFIISFFVVLMIPFIESSEWINKSLKSRKFYYLFFTWTSTLTYALYLIHMAVYQVAPFQFAYLNSWLQLLLLYSIAIFLYVFFEHPFMSLRDDFSFRQYYTTIKASFQKLHARS